jgi:hypothetical protein
MSDEPLHGSVRAEIPARFIDLSEGGALLEIAAPLEVGTIHDFALEIEGQTIWVQAEVKHTLSSPSGGYRVGVHFVGLDPQDEQRLRAYLGVQD